MEKTTPRPSIPGCTSHTACVRATRLHFWMGGDPTGAPVLLWHGFRDTAYVWRKVMPALADAGLAVAHVLCGGRQCVVGP